MLFRSSTSGSQSHCGFEGVVDPPLQTGEGTDHEYSG